ncbi:FlxA-like family protein [Aeromonas jandaei]|uniref:FlxA-like family protein n=1 Tax=Aeromonas jandaei TaxID=650 RepID=UPI002AA0DF2F|nr:FlxA-like family protein [Aeromonas jandaei]
MYKKSKNMKIYMPPSAIGRVDPAAGSDKSGEPPGKIAQLQAKAAKIQKQINSLLKPDENAQDDKESAKLRQDLIKVLQLQLAMIMAEIARLQSDKAKGDEPAPQEQGTPVATDRTTLLLNSTFTIKV